MSMADEDLIRDIELRFNEAWGRHDADDMVELLADDAQFVTVNGAWTKTRAEYLDLMQRLHGPNGPFRLSTRNTPEMHVRFLAPDVAMMHSRIQYTATLMRACVSASAPVWCIRSMGSGALSQSRTPTCALAGGIRDRSTIVRFGASPRNSAA